ncbi:hypothetical protein M747DRAFT_360643 [Aspergillus niger ATCC 13496]|uniref:Contig An04c0400, genomic contig n=3 Tax=Aspergillus niger TaxID=5061 RepID=A2QKF1_ASPNC|nr:uncharacterized protein An04g10400 [Aspergillus niger]RDH15374.1 hypothetical protein M747DRAFT_360643 [Aspergillus niger ATCC 13496]CAK44820.1 unnamed protein product [Aspergillus niger]|eukprot:XP_001402394.1 laccase-1 [Aspergillus niger CBS 513.88]
MAFPSPLFAFFMLLGLLDSVRAIGNWSCPDLITSSVPVKFALILTEQNISPDGFQRKGILVNGQFPGPILEVCQGVEVEVQVWNELPYPVTVHFHGIEQRETPWSDGVPGVSQKGIQPGLSFTYKWRATDSRSYFYHSYERGHLEDGLYGAIYIHPRNSVERPFAQITDDPSQLEAMHIAEQNTKPIILSDWRHLASEQVWEAEEATGLDAYCANALLINGKGSVTCLSQETIDEFTSEDLKPLLNGSHLTDIGCLPPTIPAAQGPYRHNFSAVPQSLFSGCNASHGATETLLVDPGLQYSSWDLINAGGLATLSFSIDEHPMYVYAVDGRYIVPKLVEAVKLVPGRRFSVLVKLDKPPRDYTVRSNIVGNQILNTTTIMSYDAAVRFQNDPSTPYIDITGRNATPDAVLLDETQVVPFPVEVPAQTADQTFVLHIDRFNSSYQWTLGNGSFPLSLEEAAPLLFYPDSEVAHSDLTIRTTNGSWVDLIFYVRSAPQPEHPIHKHSNKFFYIGSGQGEWEYPSVAEAMRDIPHNFNLHNPPLFDTIATPAAMSDPVWTAVRYHVVNPGAFVVHCHIQVHINGGMSLAVLDGIDAWPQIPDEYQITN